MTGNYQLRFAVCDDEPQDRSALLRMVADYLDRNHYSISVDAFESGEQLLEGDVTLYDLIVLDVFVGRRNGIEVAKEILVRNPGAQIIFCSTSNAFAAESYDVAALRYLIKPVSEEKLFHTLDRYFHAHTTLRTLTFKQNRMDEHIYVADVIWIEAGDHKSIIHTRDGDITTRTTIAQLLEQLDGMDFIRPIRYALVPLKAVVTIPNDTLTLVDGTVIPISRDQRAAVKKAYTDHKMKQLLQKGGFSL